MDKDRVEGKIKDVAGRVERQVGEWTGDSEKQAHGAAKQAEGKVQNTWGKVKDAAKSATDNEDRPSSDVDTRDADDLSFPSVNAAGRSFSRRFLCGRGIRDQINAICRNPFRMDVSCQSLPETGLRSAFAPE